MPRILAIESSAARCSAAALEGRRVVAEKYWRSSRDAGGEMFAALESVRSAADWDWAEVDVFVVGRGPGSYAGLRTAFAAARMLALPGRRRMCCLSSGVVLAAGYLEEEQSAESVIVAGDARRGMVWYASFRRGDGPLPTGDGWRLCAYEQFSGKVPAGVRVISPEKERLAGRGMEIPGMVGVSPEAGRLGLLAAELLEVGGECEPCEPLYMHPAV